MAAREVRGNEYDGSFAAGMTDRREHIFDSIECAAQAIARTCAHGGCRVLGHGVQHEDKVNCCANRARRTGTGAIRDRA